MTLLYHFTAAHMLESIKQEGLTRGVIVMRFVPPRFRRNFQWLTANPNWNQPWTEGVGRIGYTRTAYRLSIQIPDKESRMNLCPWILYGERFVPRSIFDTLNAEGDPNNWYVYHGTIKPEWIVETTKTPRAQEVTL